MAEPAVVTLKQIAARAGQSIATVSYALRGHPKIPESTRERVRAVAAELGYRPNPRVASLMAHIRGAQARPQAERIGFVWVQTTRRNAARDPFLRLVFSGARRRAEQAGFALEEFWTSDPGMTDRRLQEILRARGIVGVVLSPVTTTGEASLAFEWDWSLFATAVIGNVAWTPELHHAGHHHYFGMRMALNELGKLGCERPAVVIEEKINERAKRAWEAAFLTHHPAGARSRGWLRLVGDEGVTGVPKWLKAIEADALIVSNTSWLTESAAIAEQVRRIKVATLHWSKDTPRDMGGVDQCYDRVAAHAVDLVVAQLHNNERGVPDLPSMMLFPGRWVAPVATRRLSERGGAQ